LSLTALLTTGMALTLYMPDSFVRFSYSLIVSASLHVCKGMMWGKLYAMCGLFSKLKLTFMLALYHGACKKIDKRLGNVTIDSNRS